MSMLYVKGRMIDLVTDLLEGETEAEGGEIAAVCQLVSNVGGIVGFGANNSIGDYSM